MISFKDIFKFRYQFIDVPSTQFKIATTFFVQTSVIKTLIPDDLGLGAITVSPVEKGRYLYFASIFPCDFKYNQPSIVFFLENE